MVLNIIPGLPNDLAELCLARVPKGLHAVARCVSRAWMDALEPSSIDALRRHIGIIEHWVMLCILGDFYLVDPLLARCQALPRPPPIDHGLKRLHIMAVNRGEVVAAFPGVQCRTFWLDVVSRRWSERSGMVERTSFASAAVGGYAYMASDFLAYNLPFQGADRLDLRTGRTDRLPNMHRHRYSAAAVVLNGSFCVLSGYSDDDSGALEVLSSGEIWDRQSASWVLVPNMWPPEMGCSCPPMVVDVKGKLYGLRQGTDQVFSYDEKGNLWTSLGCIPSDIFTIPRALLAVGDELWGVCTSIQGVSIIATCLAAGKPLMWRELPYKIPCPDAWVTARTALVVTV